MTTLTANPPPVAPPRRAVGKPRRSPLRILLALLAVLVFLAALAAIGGIVWYQTTYANRIFPGVSVRGIDLSGLTLPAAQQTLSTAFDPYPLAPVTVQYGDQRWTLSTKDLGVNFDADSAAAAALRVGRKPITGPGVLVQAAQLQANLQEQLAAYRFSHDVLADEAIDRSAGLNWLEQRAQEINRPTAEATLRINGLQVSSTPSQTGYALDVATSLEQIYTALVANRGETVALTVRTTPPLLAEVTQAEVFVRQALAGPVVLVADTPDIDAGAPPPSYTVSADDLAQLVSTKLSAQADGTLQMIAQFDEEPLRARVAGWAAELAREPRNATVNFNPLNYVISVATPSQTGRILDVDATLAAIRSGALSPVRQVTLPLTLIEPSVNSHKINEMGIRELVAEGSSTFRGSSPERMHNIATAAAAVDNAVVAPGEVFSFNQTIGDVSKEYGYQDALVIWGDRTAIGIGGGVCQVSTTVFRAAFYGGFPIVERWNHGYVVSWYGTPGLDATIYTPSVDFRFRNTTNHHLIIKSEMNAAKGTLAFKFYGTKPAWTVSVTGPEILKEIPAPPAVYETDLTLAAGQVKQVEWSSNGMDVIWRRVIRDTQGQVISSEALSSSYTPWAAHYLIGPQPVSQESSGEGSGEGEAAPDPAESPTPSP